VSGLSACARGYGWRCKFDMPGLQERDEITYEAYQSVVVVNEVLHQTKPLY
jgi:hypothetical protein